jgi:hypothetical protein
MRPGTYRQLRAIEILAQPEARVCYELTGSASVSDFAEGCVSAPG